MGNRAVIAFGTGCDALGVYLHWNGGPESVKAFLDATRELMKSRGPDEQYGPARLVQVIGNFFGGTLSLGIGLARDLDCDNGLYVVDPGSLQITARKHIPAGRDATFDETKYAKVLGLALERSTEAFGRGA